MLQSKTKLAFSDFTKAEESNISSDCLKSNKNYLQMHASEPNAESEDYTLDM